MLGRLTWSAASSPKITAARQPGCRRSWPPVRDGCTPDAKIPTAHNWFENTTGERRSNLDNGILTLLLTAGGAKTSKISAVDGRDLDSAPDFRPGDSKSPGLAGCSGPGSRSRGLALTWPWGLGLAAVRGGQRSDPRRTPPRQGNS